MSKLVKIALVTTAASLLGLPMAMGAATPDIGSLIRTGYQQLAAGSFPEAVQTLSAAVYNAPSSFAARRYLAHALVRSGDATNAAQQFTMAAQISPLEAVDESALGDAYLALQTLPEASNAYQRAIAMNPRLEVAWAGLAKTYEVAGSHDLALSICKQGIGWSADRAGGQYLAGVLDQLEQGTLAKEAKPEPTAQASAPGGGPTSRPPEVEDMSQAPRAIPSRSR